MVQPCFVFVGEGFESNPDLRMAKSLLLDFFRGRQIDAINLKVRSQNPLLALVMSSCLNTIMLVCCSYIAWSSHQYQSHTVTLGSEDAVTALYAFRRHHLMTCTHD